MLERFRTIHDMQVCIGVKSSENGGRFMNPFNSNLQIE